MIRPLLATAFALPAVCARTLIKSSWIMKTPLAGEQPAEAGPAFSNEQQIAENVSVGYALYAYRACANSAKELGSLQLYLADVEDQE